MGRGLGPLEPLATLVRVQQQTDRLRAAIRQADRVG
jgi:hypothetical protein